MATPLTPVLISRELTEIHAILSGGTVPPEATLKHLQLLAMQSELIELELAWWRQEISAADMSSRTQDALLRQGALLRSFEPGGLN